jgi:hypothetical protein
LRIAHIMPLSHEAGLDNRLPDTLYAVYAAAVAAGLGAKDSRDRPDAATIV